jgi:hypothetical protein
MKGISDMRKSMGWMVLMAGVLLAGNAMGLALGTNVTVWDQSGQSAAGWNEDNETEPGMVNNDLWDLEGVFIDRNSPVNVPSTNVDLNLVGTYDFVNGASNLTSGDLFIDQTGDAIYGDTNTVPLDPFGLMGWDFALAFEQNANGTWVTGPAGVDGDGAYVEVDFELVAIVAPGTQHGVPAAGDATLNDQYDTVSEPGNVNASNPWRLHTRPNTYSYTARLYTGVAVDAPLAFDSLGSTPNTRRVLQIDWSDISGLGFEWQAGLTTVHFTMECGNDNLIGSFGNPRTPPVPEPASLALLGMGLLGVAMRKRFTA